MPAFTLPLSELLPPDDPDSEWVMRLAVVRDDLLFQLTKAKAIGDADGVDASWERAYWLRQLAITIDNTRHVLARHPGLGKYIKTRIPDLEKSVVLTIKNAIAAVDQAGDFLKTIRDGIGAHVQPEKHVDGVLMKAAKAAGEEYIKPSESVVTRVVRQHGTSLNAEIKFGDRPATMSYRGLTRCAPLLCWPDVAETEELFAKTRQVRDHLDAMASECLEAIDHLLAQKWGERPVVAVAIEKAVAKP